VPSPKREYFYTIDTEGRLWHAGTELQDPVFLDFFFRRLRSNDTGRHADWPFVSPCGIERNFVRARWPVVFHTLEQSVLRYAATLEMAFDPSALRVTSDGRLLHPAVVGGHGAFTQRLTLQLGESIRETEGGYLLGWQGRNHPVGPHTTG
jgi:hypothetical protein